MVSFVVVVSTSVPNSLSALGLTLGVAARLCVTLGQCRTLQLCNALCILEFPELNVGWILTCMQAVLASATVKDVGTQGSLTLPICTGPFRLGG
jgi:hypothetical protein